MATLEQARAVHARQVARNDVQRADFVGTTAVSALAGFDDHGAHGVLFKRLQRRSDVGAPCSKLFLAELLGLDAGLELFHLAHASLLVSVFQSRGHLVEEGVHALVDGRVSNMDGPLYRRDVATIQETLLSFAELRDGFLAEVHGAKHKLFGNLVGACLNHGDVVSGAGDGEL